jgi:hypothetical protein
MGHKQGEGPSKQRQYEQEIHSKVDEIEISSDTELEWNNIENTINDTANQVVGTKIKERNAIWCN